MATASPPCSPPTNCPKVCSPTCTQGYTCVLSVIDSLCACPATSCVKVDFDTGTGDSDSKKPTPSPTPTPSKSSVLGPVLGGIFGALAVALIAYFLVRRQRKRRRTNAEQAQEKGRDDQLDGTPTKAWPTTGTGATIENKDVIRIAYIPSSGSEASLPMSQTLDLGGAPQASFMAPMDKNYNKHDSMASTISTGTLDQAIHMAVKAKATPQLIRLNTIKAANSDLIQRSNSLHSSNSIKRTKSQRRLAEAKKLGKNLAPSSPLGSNPFEQEAEAQTMDQEEQIQEPEYEYTPAVILTGPSARSSAQSSTSVRRIPGPTMVLEARPIQKPPSPSSTSSTLVATPTTTLAPTALVSLLASSSPTSPRTRNPFTSPSPSPTTMSSPSTGIAPRISFEPTDPFSMEVQDNFDIDQERANLRPWTARGNGVGQRDSTFSTGSDARSLSTRADGEEIMIFWDGHRDSKVSLP